MKSKLEKQKEILFLNRLLSSEHLDKVSKDLIKIKIKDLIKEILEK